MNREQFAVVGGGPVGLAAAILLAGEGYIVTVYEKRHQYTRQRIVLLRPRNLPWLPGVESKMRICELEEKLKDLALTCGVKFVEREVTQLNELHQELVVIATGSKSVLRDSLATPEYLTDPKRVVECKYSASNHPQGAGPVAHYKTMKVLGGVAVEQVKDHIVVLLWEPPRDLNEADIQARLRFWVGIRGDILQQDTLRYSIHHSTLYRCRPYAQLSGRKRVFLVGDAAAGVPYFQSLQFGLENLVYLRNLDGYGGAMEAVTAFQTSAMLSASISLDFAGMFLRVSNVVPWQVMKWDPHLVRELSAAPLEFN